MQSVSKALKRRRFEKIYKFYVDDIYRICLYYSKDEEVANDVTIQVFMELYKMFDEVDSKHIFSFLVHKAKELLADVSIHESATEEVTG